VEVEEDNSYDEIISSIDDNNSQADFVRRELSKLKEWSKPSNEAKALFKSLYTHFMTAVKKFGIKEKELSKLFEAYKIAIEMALPMGAKFVNGCFKDAKFVLTKDFLAKQLKITSMTAKHRIAGLKALGLIQPVADHKLGGYKKTGFYKRRYGIKSYQDDHNQKRYYVDGTEYYQLPELLFENPQLWVEKVLELYAYLKEEVGKTCFWNVGTRKLEEYLAKWEAYIEEQLLSINMSDENIQENQEEVEMKETIVNVYEKYMIASNQEINEKTKYHDALVYMQDVINLFRGLFARAAASSWILDDDLAA
jgi:hypothetical protein